MLAGAAVFAVDIALVLAYRLILNRNAVRELSTGKWMELILEHGAFEIAALMVGALLGLTGASGSSLLGYLLGKNRAPSVRA